MKHEKIDPAGCDDGAKENCVSTAQPYSKTERKSPTAKRIPPMPERAADAADWRRHLVDAGFFDTADFVTGPIGPIEVIGSPRVCVCRRGNETHVWIGGPVPWGWDNKTVVFLGAPNAALKHAFGLAMKLRAEAEREFRRRERIKAARLAELAAQMEGRGK